MTNYTRPNSKYPKNWNKLRFSVFKRDNYICQYCGVSGHIGHHEHNAYYYPEKCLDMEFIKTACKRCHDKIHGR